MVVATLIMVAASGRTQVMDTDDIILPTPTEQAGGAVTPYFWVGAQAVGSLGVNLNNGAFGLRNHAGDTWVSFNIAFVDSLYMAPKSYEVGNDPSIWSGHLALRNYTARLNSWEEWTDSVNTPVWLAEVQGHGFHIGLFSQAGALFHGDNVNVPSTINSGDLVLYLNDADVRYGDFLDTSNPLTTAEYDGSALLYAGYEQEELFRTYVTLTTEGNATESDAADADGVAGALDVTVTPFGTHADEEQPFILDITANAVYGYGFDTNPIGFGIRVQPTIHLVDYYALTPVVAFEGMVPEGESLQWSAGAGVLMSLSGKRWTGDFWGEAEPASYFDTYYENSQILKFAYAQAYAAFSPDQDLDLVLKFEEPDGEIGFHENLGALAEFRLNNVIGTGAAGLGWSAIGRISYDLDNHTLIPSLRVYVNYENTIRIRPAIEFAGIPHTSFELSYSSSNLNHAAPGDFDLGTIELVGIIKTDAGIIRVPRNMNAW
jgi:hypothetical protein